MGEMGVVVWVGMRKSDLEISRIGGRSIDGLWKWGMVWNCLKMFWVFRLIFV